MSDWKDLVEQQKARERRGFDEGIKRYDDYRNKILKSDQTDNVMLRPEAIELSKYEARLQAAISHVLGKPINTNPSERDAWREVNNMLREGIHPAQISHLMLRVCFNVENHEGLAATAELIGETLRREWEYAKFKKIAGGYLKTLEENVKVTHNRRRRAIIKHSQTKMGVPDVVWTKRQKLCIGFFLIRIMQEAIDLFEIKRIISPDAPKRYKNQNRLAMSKQGQEFIDTLNEEFRLSRPVIEPMIIPPKDWTDTKDGGLYTRRCSKRLIRSKYFKSYKVAEEGDLTEVCSVVNALQKTKWAVNVPMLEVLDVIRKDLKNPLGGLPQLNLEDQLAAYELFNPMPERLVNPEDKESEKTPEWFAWVRGIAKIKETWERETSKRISLDKQCRIARSLIDLDAFYLAWTLDYRGRIYPIQTWLNPQSDDVARGLLQFAEGKPLGKDGAHWLAIHGANSFGEDKVTFKERFEWVLKNEAKILASAENPLDIHWWADADKPFQFLAFCMEWAGYRREGESFLSHIPVQMDGTCSGNQHFSALLADEVGAAAVSVSPSPKPTDVYAEVAKHTIQILKHRANGIGVDDNYQDEEIAMAKAWLTIGITRKETKRNVMTIPYGATLLGFCDQLQSHCIKYSIDEQMPEGVKFSKACMFLAKVNKEAIKMVLVKAFDSMAYIQDLSSFMGKHQLPMVWTNPVGLRCYQKVMHSNTKRFETAVGSVRIRMTLRTDGKKFDPRGMRAKSSPNFIHSMDAGHLMKTVGALTEQGVTDFSMIHDSFGVHACNVPLMNRVLREEFAKIYSSDWLQKLTDELRAQVPEKLHKKFDEIAATKPVRGSLDINCVLDSEYFFA